MLERTKYDRPSLHSLDPTTRWLGRLMAVIDQHIDAVHPEYMANHGSLEWKNLRCALCGFDAPAELRVLWPEQ